MCQECRRHPNCTYQCRTIFSPKLKLKFFTTTSKLVEMGRSEDMPVRRVILAHSESTLASRQQQWSTSSQHHDIISRLKQKELGEIDAQL